MALVWPGRVWGGFSTYIRFHPPFFPGKSKNIYNQNKSKYTCYEKLQLQNVFLLYFQSDCWLYDVLYRNSGAGNDWPSIVHQNYDNHFTWIITTNLYEKFYTSSSQGFTSIHSIYLFETLQKILTVQICSFSKWDISQTELLKKSKTGHTTVFSVCKNENLGLGRPLNLLFWCFLPIFIH